MQLPRAVLSGSLSDGNVSMDPEPDLSHRAQARGMGMPLLGVVVLWMALSTACSAAPLSAQTSPSARRTLPALPTPTASPPPSDAVASPTAPIDWKTYRNQTFNFAFEYPAAYDEPDNAPTCGLKVIAQPDGMLVQWGSRSSLMSFPSQGQSAEEVLRARLTPDAVQVDLSPVTADGIRGERATFRFGGLARFGEIYAFVRDDRAFVGAFTSGAMCEPDGLSILEPAVFDHAMQTLRFEP
jgi:hypothetical protein